MDIFEELIISSDYRIFPALFEYVEMWWIVRFHNCNTMSCPCGFFLNTLKRDIASCVFHFKSLILHEIHGLYTKRLLLQNFFWFFDFANEMKKNVRVLINNKFECRLLRMKASKILCCSSFVFRMYIRWGRKINNRCPEFRVEIHYNCTKSRGFHCKLTKICDCAGIRETIYLLQHFYSIRNQ